MNHSRLAHLRSLDFVYAAAADYDDDVVVDEEGGAAGVADGDDFGEMIQAKLAVPAGFKVSEPQKETRHDCSPHNSRKDAHHNPQLLMKLNFESNFPVKFSSFVYKTN